MEPICHHWPLLRNVQCGCVLWWTVASHVLSAAMFSWMQEPEPMNSDTHKRTPSAQPCWDNAYNHKERPTDCSAVSTPDSLFSFDFFGNLEDNKQPSGYKVWFPSREGIKVKGVISKVRFHALFIQLFIHRIVEFSAFEVSCEITKSPHLNCGQASTLWAQ